MTRQQPVWLDKITLRLDGFNPSPLRVDGTLTVIYRKKHGTYARQYSQDYAAPTGDEYLFNSATEDLRPVTGTHPPIVTGALYSRTTSQAAILTTRHAGQIIATTRPIIYRIQRTRRRPTGKPEKNWLIWLHGQAQLRGIYNACPHILIEPGDEPAAWRVTHRQPWTAPAWTAGLSHVLRCSTPPIATASGRLLTLWHLKDRQGGYWTGATLHEPDWPHNPIAATARPLFTPQDASDVSPHWPPNTCIFPMFAEINSNETVTLWAGDSDRTCCVYRTPLANLLNSMEPTR